MFQVLHDIPDSYTFQTSPVCFSSSPLCTLLSFRLYEEMKAHFQLSVDIPSSDRNLVLDLPSWLSMAGRLSCCVIVLDALNQLDSGSGSAGECIMRFNPLYLPFNVILHL